MTHGTMNSLAIILQSTDLLYSSLLLPPWPITNQTDHVHSMLTVCWSLNSNTQSGGCVILLENILHQEMTHAIVHISDLLSLLSFI